MFESRISAGANEKITRVGKTSRKDGGCVVLRHGRTCTKNAWRDIAIWRTKKQSSYAKSQVLAWAITISRKRNLNQLENCQTYAHKFLKCLHLARIGGLDILWSANTLARSVTKRRRACDSIRLARLVSYIHHTSDYRQYCHVGNTAQHCRLGLFQDSDFAGDLEDSKSTSGRGRRRKQDLMFFWKSNIRPHQMDVQEANVSIPQFLRIKNHFVVPKSPTNPAAGNCLRDPERDRTSKPKGKPGR